MTFSNFNIHSHRRCDHKVWLKRCRTRAEKAIIIYKVQASANNLKATLLNKGHVVRASEETNTKLNYAMSCAERRTRAWMITSVNAVVNC